MNIQKIFDALDEDSQNSTLGILCSELESQGYSVSIEDMPVTFEGIFENLFPEMENKQGLITFSHYKNKEFVQKFGIEFVEYHEVALRKAS